MSQDDGQKKQGFAGAGKRKIEHRGTGRAGGTPLVNVPNCRVCAHALRPHVDRMLLTGAASLREVVAFIKEVSGDEIGTSSVHRHARHMSMREQALRRVVQRRMGIDDAETEDAADLLISRRAMLEAVATDGFDKIVGGEVRYTVGEWAAILDRLRQAEADEDGASREVMQRQLLAFVAAVKQVLPADQFAQVWVIYKQNLGEEPGLPALPQRSVDG